MSDIFATQITAGLLGNNKSALTGITLAGGKTEAQTVDFWNFILGQISDEEFRVGTNSKDTQDNLSSDKLKGEKVDLALLKLALLGQDADGNLDQKLAELKIERLVLQKENRIEQLTKLVNHLTNGLPNPPESGTVEQLVQRLNSRLEKLEASFEAFRSGDFGKEGSPFKLLIATGLNPAQLTEITNRIEEVESKLGRELTVEDLIAGVGNIVPAPGDDEHEFSAPDGLSILTQKEKTTVEVNEKGETIIVNTKTATGKQTEEIKIIASQKNIVEDVKGNGKETNGLPEEAIPGQAFYFPVISDKPAENNGKNIPDSFNGAKTVKNPLIASNDVGNEPTTNETIGLTTEFSEEIEGQLSNAEFKELFGNNKLNANANFSLTNKAINNNALANAVQAVQNNISGNIPAIFIDESTVSSQISLSETLGFDLQTGTPFNQTIQAAHFVSSPTVAGQPHPATKTVAAHITKAANNGETRGITLQLDPPELGRVEVRLEFGKEKSVKAHLVVEKPETLLMLQRDAGALEKALQDSGLSANSGSLNYEMASEGHSFGGNRDNDNGGGKTGTDLERDNDEIVTTMTWDVDPETGHVHYSILA